MGIFHEYFEEHISDCMFEKWDYEKLLHFINAIYTRGSQLSKHIDDDEISVVNLCMEKWMTRNVHE